MKRSFSGAPPGKAKPPFSRRDALFAGLSIAGGCLAGSGLLRAANRQKENPPEIETPNEGVEQLLEMDDDDVLCRAETILAQAETTPWGDLVRRLLLRLLCACMESISPQNDLIAAKCIYLLSRNKWLTPSVIRLVRRTNNAPIAQAALISFSRSIPNKE